MCRRLIKTIKSKLWIIRHKANTLLFPVAAKIFYFFPINKKRIVVANYHGKGYGDNPKFIVDELLKQNTDCEIVWLVDEYMDGENNLPSQVKRIQYYSMKSMYYLATACVWIDNCRKDYSPRKKENQLYIQTWHGGLGFKNVEAKCVQDLPKFYLKHAKEDAKITDLMISNSKKTSEIYREMFWYNGRILETGLPRNDELVLNSRTEEQINLVKKELKISNDAHIILYAPTFRDQYNLEPYDLRLPDVCNAFKEKFGGNWVAVYRLHPNIKADYANKKEFTDCIDATKYLNSEALLLAADVFISDFSSMVFDFILNRKLVLLYASDYEEYISTRGVWLQYSMTAFPYAFSNEDLIDKIKELDMPIYQEKLESMLNKFGMRETGQSAVTIAKVIQEYLRILDLQNALESVAYEGENNRYLLK